MRGKRNDSSNLRHIVEKIAEIKGISPEDVAAASLENGKRLFEIK
jgi:TatD DNase family protein